MLDKPSFYEKIKADLFGGLLSQPQVEGMEAIINEADEMDIKQLAYVLGTVYHETGKTMQPVEEIGKGKNRTYGHRVWYNGNRYNDIDVVFYGRGFTQNTWRDVYLKLTIAAKKNGRDWDFVNKPELLLQVDPSAWASIYAMRTGLYTGRKLSQYINDQVCDYINARRIVNILDCATKIAEYAELFLTALK